MPVEEEAEASLPREVSEAEEAGALWDRPEFGRARRVERILPPSDRPAVLSPAPSDLTEFRGRLYFGVNLIRGTRTLWRSDGTESGTSPVKVFPARTDPGAIFDSLRELTAVGNRLFFVVGDDAAGTELWVSDGTGAGTHRVKDIAPGSTDSNPSGLTALGGRLVFFRFIPGSGSVPSRYEVWRSDGTDAGTVRVRDLGPDSSISSLTEVVGNTLFFIVTDPAHGTELWKTDGTSSGTGLVKDIAPGAASSYPFDLRAAGGKLFFTVTDPSRETVLWKSDGTTSGTVFVKDLDPNPELTRPRLLAPLGKHLYFTRTDSADVRLRVRRLRLDGSGRCEHVAVLPNPFPLVTPLPEPFISTFTAADDRLYFSVGFSSGGPAPRTVQLWVTDGTNHGTKKLREPLSLSDEFESSLFAVDGSVLFASLDLGGTGLEPWVSDGSVRGTRLLQDINPGSDSSFPQGFTRVGDRIFFAAFDDTDAFQLWVLRVKD
ncbi:hypothetical protein P2318_13375 [Myxococcaceae bacterium GXIMD 01537]